MFCCGTNSMDCGKDFNHEVSTIENGVVLTITTENKEKADALKNMLISCQKLCES